MLFEPYRLDRLRRKAITQFMCKFYTSHQEHYEESLFTGVPNMGKEFAVDEEYAAKMEQPF